MKDFYLLSAGHRGHPSVICPKSFHSRGIILSLSAAFFGRRHERAQKIGLTNPGQENKKADKAGTRFFTNLPSAFLL